MECAIAASLKQEESQDVAGEDDDAELKAALALSLEDPDEELDTEEQERFAIEMSMQKDADASSDVVEDKSTQPGLPTAPNGLVDEPDQPISPGHQRKLANARRAKAKAQFSDQAPAETKPADDVDLVAELNTLASYLENRAEPGSQLQRICIRAITIVSMRRYRVGEQLAILQQAMLDFPQHTTIAKARMASPTMRRAKILETKKAEA
jgi:hypothetical protein